MAQSRTEKSKKALIEALEKSLGVVTTACKIVGVDRGTFYNYLKDDEDFAKKVQEIENVTLDFVESQLHKQPKADFPPPAAPPNKTSVVDLSFK